MVTIERLHDLAALAALIAEGGQSGSRFVGRLATEWDSGANRFDKPGEALFVARVDGRPVGVCGLNVDLTQTKDGWVGCATSTSWRRIGATGSAGGSWRMWWRQHAVHSTDCDFGPRTPRPRASMKRWGSRPARRNPIPPTLSTYVAN